MLRFRSLVSLLTPIVLAGCRTGLGVEDLGSTPVTTSPDSGSPTSDAGTTFDSTSPPGEDVGSPPARDCPPDLPKIGSGCAIVGATCTYDRGKFGPCSDSSANNQLAYRCEDTGWLEVARCIDRTSCPATRPRAGDACTQNGLDCFYDAPTACAEDAIMQCVEGRFVAVNDCSPGARADGPLVVTLKDDRRVLIDGGTFPVGSMGAAIAGTQLMVGALLRPAPHQAGHRFLAQTAVPRMPMRFSPAPGDASFFMGEVIAPPRLAFFRDRFLFAYPISDEADATPGLVTQWVPLDGSKGGSSLADATGIEAGDVALGGATGGFVAFRGWLKDSAGAHGGVAMAIDLEGKPMGPRTMLTDEVKGPFGPPVRRAYARVAAWKGGFVFVAPTPALGDLWDDAGVGLWFVPLGATRVDDSPKTILPIGNQDVSIVALSDGSAVVAYAYAGGATPFPEPPTGVTFHLTRVMPDGSQHPLPPEMSEMRGTTPALPALVARENGFAMAWLAGVAGPTDGVTTMLHVAGRTADGLVSSPTVRWSADGADPKSVPELVYAPVDATLHVLWTEGSPSRVFRERLLCTEWGLD